MKIHGIPLPGAPTRPDSVNLVKDQLVHGRVIGRQDDNRLRIQLGGQRYTATMRTPGLVDIGQQGLFRVDRLAPDIELKLVQLMEPGRESVPGAMLRNLTPLPGNPADHQARLQALLRDEAVTARALASPLARDLAGKLGARVLAATDLQRQGSLRQAFLHSGIFRERQQLQGAGQGFDANYRVAEDNKALLALFAIELEEIQRKFSRLQGDAGLRAYTLHANALMTANLAKDPGNSDETGLLGLLGLLTRDSLGSVTLNQARTLDAHAAGIKAWYFDLQMQFHGDYVTVPVAISRDGGGNSAGAGEQAEEDWRVEFSMSGGRFGHLDVATRLRGNAVSITIATDRETLRTDLTGQVAWLTERLAGGGLELTRFECRLQEPA